MTLCLEAPDNVGQNVVSTHIVPCEACSRHFRHGMDATYAAVAPDALITALRPHFFPSRTWPRRRSACSKGGEACLDDAVQEPRFESVQHMLLSRMRDRTQSGRVSISCSGCGSTESFRAARGGKIERTDAQTGLLAFHARRGNLICSNI